MIDPPTICICTFRRDSIAETLQSLALLEPDLPPAEIVIVDNDGADGAKSRIEQAARQAGLTIRYIHAPSCNISIARNAALDACTTRWAALIDDDEIARPDWLSRLCRKANEGQAVIGVSRAIYSKHLPAWAALHDFHSNRLTGDFANAYTSNALIDVAFVRHARLRFREDLGQTGGEDTLFFRQFARAGGRIVYEPDAIVEEKVSSSRATMRWILLRSYRSGQTHGLVLSELDPAAYRKLLVTASAKLAVCMAMTLLSAWRKGRWRYWMRRGALHAGALSYVVKPQILREYDPANSGS